MTVRLLQTTYQEILDDIKSTYKANAAPYGLDTTYELMTETGLILNMLAVVKRQNQTEINFAFRQNTIDGAEGEYLDYIGELEGVERNEGQQALTILSFVFTMPLPVQVTIPAGTRVKSTDGLVEFMTDTDTICSVGTSSIEVAATATNTGTEGNAY